MAITIAQAFMNQVRATLDDPEPGSYWLDAELIGYYNLFVTAVIADKPDALVKVVQFPLAAGVDQVLPADGVQLLRVPSNVPYIGLKRTGITQVSAEALQDADPEWYNRPPVPYARHVIPDKHDPLKFQVSPPNDGTGQVVLSYAYAPADAAAVTDNFGLTEAYRDAAYHYVLAKAYLKGPRDLARAQYHEQMYQQALGAKVQAQAQALARVGTPGTTE